LKKTDPERMATVLWVTIEVVRIISIMIQPVMPDSAGKILDLLGVPAGAGEAGAKVLPTAAETGSGAEAMETVTAGAGIGVAAGAAYASAGLAPNVAEAAAGGLADAGVDPRSFAAVAFPLEPGTPLPKPEPVFPKFVEESEYWPRAPPEPIHRCPNRSPSPPPTPTLTSPSASECCCRWVPPSWSPRFGPV